MCRGDEDKTFSLHTGTKKVNSNTQKHHNGIKDVALCGFSTRHTLTPGTAVLLCKNSLTSVQI